MEGELEVEEIKDMKSKELQSLKEKTRAGTKAAVGLKKRGQKGERLRSQKSTFL